MSDINSVIIIGRLTRDSELRYTNSGMAIAKFSIAVNRIKGSGDQREKEVSFFDCTLFGKYAESINQYLVKGQQVVVVGELRQSTWEADGQKRSKVEILARNLQLIGKSPENQSGANQAGSYNNNGNSYNNNSGNNNQQNQGFKQQPNRGNQNSGNSSFSGNQNQGNQQDIFDSDEIPF